MVWLDPSSLRPTSVGVENKEELQIYQELGGDRSEKPDRKLKGKHGSHELPDVNLDRLRQPNAPANPLGKTLELPVHHIRGVVSTVRKRCCSLARVVSSGVSSCCLPFPVRSHNLTPASPDDSEDDDEKARLLPRKYSGGLAPSSSDHVTLVKNVVVPASEAVAPEEATTVDLGSVEDPIEVGLLSVSDYKLIVHAVCPSFG